MPHILRHQRGMSFTGLLFILIFIGLVATMALRIVPMLLEYQGVMRSITQLKASPGFPWNKQDFYKKLENNLYLNDVKNFGGDFLKESIKIVQNKKSGKKELIIKYQRDAPFFRNIYFTTKFEDVSEVTSVAD